MARNNRLIIVGVILFLLSLIFRVLNTSNVDGSNLLHVLSVETTLFVVLIIYELKKQLGSYLKVTTIFVLMFCIFMLGHTILNSLGFLGIENPFLMGKFSTHDSIESILDVQLYLSFFIIGVGLAKTYNCVPISDYEYDRNAVRIGYYILLVSLPFELIVSITKITLAITNGYASLYQDIAYEAIPSSFKILSYFFLPAVYYILFASEQKSKNEKIAIILLVMHCVFNILMGYRAYAIIPILMLFYALNIKRPEGIFSRKYRKTIILFLVTIMILVFFIFPAVRESRNTGGLSTLTVSDVLQKNSAVETIYDMGKSLQTVAYTRQLVPETYPYRYGYTYLVNLSTALPNLFWDRHPAEVYGSLGRWLTEIEDYEFYLFGGSLGYSCVAEAYINFGYWGLIFFPLLFGCLLMSIENKITSLNTPIAYASLVIVASYLIMYSRGELSELVRGFFWYMLIPRFIYKILKK